MSFKWLISLLAAAVVNAFCTIPADYLIENIPCRKTGIYISTLDQSITILEATLEGQDTLVDEVLMLDEERNKGDDNIVENDPYGSVLWPAALTVSERITHDSFLKSDGGTNQQLKPTLLELGTGTGLVALAASVSNKFESILATDYETIPLKLLDAAYLLNQNDGTPSTNTPIDTSLFDICNLSVPLPPADIVCAADILYEKSTGIALAKRCIEALERGSRVVIGCSPGRPGRPAFLEELQRLNSNLKDVNFVNVEGTTCTGERNSLICGKGSTSISDEPKMLLVALMDLTPDCLSKE
jgi:predicted nicotinamide N-methyase